MDDPVVEGDEPFSVGFELPPGVQHQEFNQDPILKLPLLSLMMMVCVMNWLLILILL